jgi:hypothetical protein
VRNLGNVAADAEGPASVDGNAEGHGCGVLRPGVVTNGFAVGAFEVFVWARTGLWGGVCACTPLTHIGLDPGAGEGYSDIVTGGLATREGLHIN